MDSKSPTQPTTLTKAICLPFKGISQLVQSRSRMGSPASSTTFYGSVKKTLKRVLSISPMAPKFVVFSILSVAGPLENRDSGWMMTDWSLFMTLFASQPGFDASRLQYRTIRNILPHFPDGRFIFGEGGCDRLNIPIPQCIASDIENQPELEAAVFAAACIHGLITAASKVKSGEKLVLLLIGHGVRYKSEFRLCISTTSGRDAEAYITKGQLEFAVMDCRGDVLVVCNSCYSRGLESTRWELVCASGAHEEAEALAISASGCVRGSAFAVCALAAAGQEQGIVLPLPRSDPQPLATSSLPMAQLPDSPPPHSFTLLSRPLAIPSSQPMSSFVNRMKKLERFLIFQSGNQFQVQGFSSHHPWHHQLPIMLTQSLVDDVTVYPEISSSNVDFLKEAFRAQGSSSSTLTLASMPLNSVRHQMDILAPEYGLLPRYLHVREGQDASLCLQYLQAPNSLSEPEISSLAFILRSRNIQSVAAQLTARNLGWWSGSRIVSFLSLEETREGKRAFEDMVEAGIPVNQFCLLFLDTFEGMWSGNDRASLWWLAQQWQDFGRPKVSLHQWSLVVNEAAAEAVGLVLLKPLTREQNSRLYTETSTRSIPVCFFLLKAAERYVS
ncbi:hypothetical protein C8J56DRAFT_1168763 [Mycena floridula]|nr:hypothetical protein C8J56DRAFT_1168763 [Mycena floridula]